jgi:hypothetical protein
MYATTLTHLSNTLTDPHDITDLLLPKLHVRVKNTVVELLFKTGHAALHLLLIQKLVQHLALPVSQLMTAAAAQAAQAATPSE